MGPQPLKESVLPHSLYPRDSGSPRKPLPLPAAAAGAQEGGESGNRLDSHVCSKQERGGRDSEQKACSRETGTVLIHDLRMLSMAL